MAEGQKGTGIAGAMDYQPRQAVDAVEAVCFVCGMGWKTASFSARVLPPMVQVCSEACAADPRYASPTVREVEVYPGGPVLYVPPGWTNAQLATALAKLVPSESGSG